MSQASHRQRSRSLPAVPGAGALMAALTLSGCTGMPRPRATSSTSSSQAPSSASAKSAPATCRSPWRGVEPTTPEKLLAELRKRNPGDTVGFKVKRGDQSLDIKVDLTDRPASTTTR